MSANQAGKGKTGGAGVTRAIVLLVVLGVTISLISKACGGSSGSKLSGRNVSSQVPDVAIPWDATVYDDSGNITITAKKDITNTESQVVAHLALNEAGESRGCVTIKTPNYSYFWCTKP